MKLSKFRKYQFLLKKKKKKTYSLVLNFLDYKLNKLKTKLKFNVPMDGSKTLYMQVIGLVDPQKLIPC